MISKKILILPGIFLLLCCNHSLMGQRQSQVLSVIVFTDFIEPQKTCDPIQNDLYHPGLIDSVRIIGLPYSIPGYQICTDTLRAESYGFVISNLNVMLDSIACATTDPRTLMDYTLVNPAGIEIPLPNIAGIHMIPNYYKPDIFLPQPEIYYYQNRRAVKTEVYYKKKMKKKVSDYIILSIEYYASHDHSFCELEYIIR